MSMIKYVKTPTYVPTHILQEIVAGMFTVENPFYQAFIESEDPKGMWLELKEEAQLRLEEIKKQQKIESTD